MHGAGLTALALAKTNVIPIVRDPPLVITPIDEEKPPPEIPPEPAQKAVTPPEAITHITPIVQTPPQPVFVQPQPLPPLPRLVPPEPVQIAVPRTDPPAPPAKKVQPARARANLASYVSDEDYPTAAVRNEEQGTTRFRLGVGPDGKVTECTVTSSSGSSALDMTTCRLMRQRAKFTPARDSDGKPASDSVTSAIRWVLPTD